MRILVSFKFFLLFCNIQTLLGQNSILTTTMTFPPTGTFTEEPIETRPPTNVPTNAPTTASPTKAPTIFCTNENFEATFSSPGEKGVIGMLKGRYLNKGKAELKVTLKFRNFEPNGVTIEKGDMLDWSLNEPWDNKGDSGWNNKCRPGRTGKHYDPTFACSPLSQNIMKPSGEAGMPDVPYCEKNNGKTIKSSKYKCTPKRADKKCERGDLSGKLGPLVVKKKKGKLQVNFKGVDRYFPRKNAAEKATGWNFVISKNGEPFLCAKFVLLCK